MVKNEKKIKRAAEKKEQKERRGKKRVVMFFCFFSFVCLFVCLCAVKAREKEGGVSLDPKEKHKYE